MRHQCLHRSGGRYSRAMGTGYKLHLLRLELLFPGCQGTIDVFDIAQGQRPTGVVANGVQAMPCLRLEWLHPPGHRAPFFRRMDT